MTEVFRSPLAEVDLLEIWFFIAEVSPDAADRFSAYRDAEAIFRRRKL